VCLEAQLNSRFVGSNIGGFRKYARYNTSCQPVGRTSLTSRGY